MGILIFFVLIIIIYLIFKRLKRPQYGLKRLQVPGGIGEYPTKGELREAADEIARRLKEQGKEFPVSYADSMEVELEVFPYGLPAAAAGELWDLLVERRVIRGAGVTDANIQELRKKESRTKAPIRDLQKPKQQNNINKGDVREPKGGGVIPQATKVCDIKDPVFANYLPTVSTNLNDKENTYIQTPSNEINKDIKGWSKAQWGMTDRQILAAFEKEAIRLSEPVKFINPDRYAPISIPAIEIQGLKFIVYFFFDEKSGELNEVLIRPIGDKPYGYFESLLKLLIQKYGKPPIIDKEHIADRASWIFPSTQVELTRIDADALDMLLVALAYKQSLRAGFDKL